MKPPKQHTLYFSHSWAPEDAELNSYVWKQVGGECNLLVDEPGSTAVAPPYYINRIEELIRRSDLFVAVLPYRAPKGDGPRGRGDDALRCSAAILFEIRLAERADRPRLILYDPATGFAPPKSYRRAERYLPYNFQEIKAFLPEGESKLSHEISSWVEWAVATLPARGHQSLTDAAILLSADLPDRDAAIGRIVDALETAGYPNPVDLRSGYACDAELIQLLSRAGLLVADIGSLEELSRYCIAHALFVPAIRLLHVPAPAGGAETLPWVLRGHPGGYQHDIICWSHPHELHGPVRDRATAMYAAAKIITSVAEGERLLMSRRHGTDRVFLSHHLPQANRALVDGIVHRLRERHVPTWEYLDHNKAGEDWGDRLQEAMESSTLFVVLLTSDYEHSRHCQSEIEWAVQHGVMILAFLVDDRTAPHVRLPPSIHQQPLRDSVEANADAVASRIIEFIESR